MKTNKILVIDGQGGKIGSMIIERLKGHKGLNIIAVGTNAAATAAMIKAGAESGATGENPVVVCCRDADVIIGPVGIVIADSMLGEVTPAMAVAIGQSRAKKILLPINRCNNVIAGVADMSIADTVANAVAIIEKDEGLGE